MLTEEQRQVRVRLAEIDRPKTVQPYGLRAQQELSDLAFGKQVKVAVQGSDRAMGRVRAGGWDVSAEMVRRGAWIYQQYNRDPALPCLEAEARLARRVASRTVSEWPRPPRRRPAPCSRQRLAVRSVRKETHVRGNGE